LPSDITDGVNTATGISAGNSLLNTCATGRNDGNQFQEDCNAIFGESDPGVQANAINQVAADQVAAQNAAATRQFRTNVGVIGGRLTQLRLAGGGVFSDNVGLAGGSGLHSDSGGGASADASFGRYGAFFNLKYRWGDEDQTRFQPKYDFDGWGAVAGLDYRFSDQAVGGVALNYMKDDVDYADNRGDMTTESWGLSGYGTLYLDNGLFLDGLIGYNWGEYDLKRDLIYSTGPQNVVQTARSKPDARMFSFSVGAGYTLATGAFSITPMARLEYVDNDVDGFTERMSNPSTDGGAMAVSMDSATYTSFTSRLGVQIARAFSHSWGVVLPSLRLDWVHEFDNDQQDVPGRFIGDIQPNGTPFFVITNNPDRDYFDLALAVSGQFAEGRSAYISYNTLLDFNDLNYNAVNAGVRLEF
jgi:outer membrane autotransporter protein